MAYDRSRTSSVLDGFTLNPLPYPVLLILALIFLFFAVSWYFSYEEVVETAEEQFGWVLFATPVVLILIVRWLSSMENSDWFSASWGSSRRTHQGPSEGSSPWGVAALILVLLIMARYQSNFLNSWFVWFENFLHRLVLLFCLFIFALNLRVSVKILWVL